MKNFLLFLFLIPIVEAQTVWEVNEGSLNFQLDHTLKAVKGESKELKGKIQCGPRECDFLMASSIKSFTTNDSNRDENMFQVTGAAKYPHAIARGKVLMEDLLTQKKKITIPVELEFHGKKAPYTAEIEVKTDGVMSGHLTLLLETHGVDRPGLFGMKIKNEVPVNFEMHWLKK